MSSISSQASTLRALSNLLAPRHLMRSGAVSREAEAKLYIETLREAADTLTRIAAKPDSEAGV